MIDLDLILDSDGIFQTIIGEYKFVYRLLTLKEYRALNAVRASLALDKNQVYLEALKRCSIQHHQLFNRNLPLGYYVSVGELIMYLSGDCEQDTLKIDIETVRSMYPAASVQEHMKRTVFNAWPTYTVDDIDQWTRPELIRKFVIAETLLQTRIPNYEILDIESIRPMGEINSEERPPIRVDDVARVNFTEDAKQQAAQNGFWETQEALEAHYSKGLTTDQAQKLDKIKQSKR